jgi:formylglycine-generating enzyme required for sulfatase activity
MSRPVAVGAALFAAFLAVGAVLFVAGRERADTARCPESARPMGPRCCPEGQSLAEGRCRGVATRCPSELELVPGGCAAPARRVRVEGGSLTIAPNDWEAEGLQARTLQVSSFELDAFEVTFARWSACVATSGCAALPEREPGLPVTGVTADAAEKLCRAAGGRLPTADEWLFAAAGEAGRRFPWGQTGLVCRRASFGLVLGPCATGATGPELAGARPDGRSPEGVFDLSGNAAEWARHPDGSARAHGGSHRSRVAGELKSWSVEAVNGAADHVGFRCAYSPPAH